MKNITTKIILVIILSLLLVFFCEAVYTYAFFYKLKNGIPVYSKGTFLYEETKKSADFIGVQINCCKERLSFIINETKYLLYITLLSVFILNEKIRYKIINYFKGEKKLFSSVTIYTFIALFMIFGVIALNNSKCFGKLEFVVNGKKHFILSLNISLFLSLFCLFFIIPLLKLMGSGFIVTFFLSFIVMHLLDDFTKVNKPSANALFSPAVLFKTLQEKLSEFNLLNRIYHIKKDDEGFNAALVGIGKSSYIEITGKLNEIKPKDINATLWHEIGHFADSSLLKRKIFKYIMILVEMGLALIIFTNIPKNNKKYNLSKESQFVILWALYYLIASPILRAITSFFQQVNEYTADNYASTNGFKKELAVFLIKCVIDHGVIIRSTAIYNAIFYSHPTPENRILTLMM